ncbi:transporter [Aquibacillus koreensis]|uniref:Transporter n=1 Tax=Aquibacillus koreensis TaxID=279446 RepID=A0A9X3WH73_9BACI|nr:transporter [Aquibacillus koreensis]MCT2537487.1 transporter [Aquibacillus koreensis]MDC3418933.1 transporter [Aquibacillus koreensis]
MQKIAKSVYEAIMILLVMVTIITLWTDHNYNSTINWVVWAFFFLDFVVRLVKSKHRWEFVKKNPFLVIAIIPFDQFFQIARIVRVFYLFRLKTITKYYVMPYMNKLSYVSTTLIGITLFSLLLVEASILLHVESAIDTYYSALYVVFSHLLFFGHQIIDIQNTISIWLLTVTTIVGIVMQGLALQWLFSIGDRYVTRIKEQNKST